MGIAEGSRSPATIQDVADLAGVSRAAVSKVIRNAYGVSDSMRARVNDAIDRLGYRPSVTARALRGTSFTIGLELPTLTNPFLLKVVEGVVEGLAGSPYQLIIAPAANDDLEGLHEITALIDRQVDGLIAISPFVSVPWLEEQAHRIPIVMLGRHDDTEAYDTVTGDDIAGTRLMLEHLRSLGHQRIAHLTLRGQVTRTPGSPHGERLSEYLRFMERIGEPPQVLRIGTVDEDAYTRVAEALAIDDRPTAVFAGSDFLALEALRAVLDAGLSTDHVAIAGYDDMPLAGHPLVGLTTIDQDGRRLGREAARLVLERVAGRGEARHVKTTPRLVDRLTTPRPHGVPTVASAGESS